MTPLAKLMSNNERLFDLAVDCSGVKYNLKLQSAKCRCGRNITEPEELKYFEQVGECFTHDILDGISTERAQEEADSERDALREDGINV